MNNHQALGINDCIQKKLNIFLFVLQVNPVKSNPEQNYYIQLSDKQALQFQKYIYIILYKVLLKQKQQQKICSKHILNEDT